MWNDMPWVREQRLRIQVYSCSKSVLSPVPQVAWMGSRERCGTWMKWRGRYQQERESQMLEYVKWKERTGLEEEWGFRQLTVRVAFLPYLLCLCDFGQTSFYLLSIWGNKINNYCKGLLWELNKMRIVTCSAQCFQIS